MFYFIYGQIITTSAEVTPNGDLESESSTKCPQFQFRNYGNLLMFYYHYGGVDSRIIYFSMILGIRL